MTRGDEYINQMTEIINNTLDDTTKDLCYPLIEHLGFMLDRLDDLKNDVNTRGVILDFKQGKQELNITNPSLKMYTKLYKTYDSTANVLLKIMDKGKKSASYNLSDDFDDF